MTRVLCVAVVAVSLAITLAGQQAGKATAIKSTAANDIFSGTVTLNQAGSITVVRKVPARADEYRVFVVDRDTRVEGKLKVNARVTVRFKADADGAVRALRVIVRADAKANAGPGRTGTP